MSICAMCRIHMEAENTTRHMRCAIAFPKPVVPFKVQAVHPPWAIEEGPLMAAVSTSSSEFMPKQRSPGALDDHPRATTMITTISKQLNKLENLRRYHTKETNLL